MMRVTASKAGLLSSCQWWTRPEAEWGDTTSDAAARGTLFHAAIARYIETGDPPAEVFDGDVGALVASAVAWVESFGRDKLSAEVALAWDPVADTAEVIGHNIDRKYAEWQARGLVCGSADIIAVNRKFRVGYVGDWSTGDGSRKGPQLRALALMLARSEGLESVTVEALEVSATGVRHVCNETLDAFALAAVAGEIAEGLSAVETSEPVPGAHCGEMYCPARATCPAVRETLAHIIPAEALVRHQWGLTIASADHAAWLYNQAKAVEAAARLVKDAVRAYVPEGGLTLEDGSVLAEGTRNMERFDKARALELLREKGASEEEIESCSRVVVESSGLRVSGASKARKLTPAPKVKP